MRSHLHQSTALLTGLLALLSLHFGLTAAYLLPLNPIKLRLAPLLASYMQPFFAQDWQFFAPEPISETRLLFLSCRLRTADGASMETNWVDVTTPWWQAQAEWRFSPAAWLSRPQDYAVQRFFEQSEVLAQLERHRTARDSTLKELAAEVEMAERERHILARHLLTRLGAAYCERWYGAERTLASRFCLAVLRFPRFSARQLPDSAGTLHYYPLEWLPYEHVASLALAGPSTPGTTKPGM